MLRKSVPLTFQIFVKTVAAALSTIMANIIVLFTLGRLTKLDMGAKLANLLIVDMVLIFTFVVVHCSENEAQGSIKIVIEVSIIPYL